MNPLHQTAAGLGSGGIARALLASLLAAILMLGPEEVSAVQHDVLVLEGARTAAIDVTLASDTSFDLGQLRMTGGGRFIGFFVESLDVPIAQRSERGKRLGAVRIRDWHAPGEAGLTVSFAPPNDAVLRAGRYRIYLLADGPARVQIPTGGSLNGTLRPAQPATASVAADSDVLTNALSASNAQPLSLTGERNLSFSGILVGRFRAYVGTIGACLHTPGGECGEKAIDGAFAGYLLSPLQDVDLAFLVSYQPGVLTRGDYVADQGATNATGLKYASAAAFTLSLR